MGFFPNLIPMSNFDSLLPTSPTVTNFSFHFSIFSFFGRIEKSKKSRENLHPKRLSWVADLKKMTHYSRDDSSASNPIGQMNFDCPRSKTEELNKHVQTPKGIDSREKVKFLPYQYFHPSQVNVIFARFSTYF